ncbi:hypothetical protein [Leptospira noguchii]|nr:hypothetical protein [Leptospira noguchii]
MKFASDSPQFSYVELALFYKNSISPTDSFNWITFTKHNYIDFT